MTPGGGELGKGNGKVGNGVVIETVEVMAPAYNPVQPAPLSTRVWVSALPRQRNRVECRAKWRACLFACKTTEPTWSNDWDIDYQTKRIIATIRGIKTKRESVYALVNTPKILHHGRRGSKHGVTRFFQWIPSDPPLRTGVVERLG